MARSASSARTAGTSSLGISITVWVESSKRPHPRQPLPPRSANRRAEERVDPLFIHPGGKLVVFFIFLSFSCADERRRAVFISPRNAVMTKNLVGLSVGHIDDPEVAPTGSPAHRNA